MKASMTRTIKLLVVALLLLGAAAPHAEELKASVERNPIHAGESVRLVLERNLVRLLRGFDKILVPEMDGIVSAPSRFGVSSMVQRVMADCRP